MSKFIILLLTNYGPGLVSLNMFYYKQEVKRTQDITGVFGGNPILRRRRRAKDPTTMPLFLDLYVRKLNACIFVVLVDEYDDISGDSVETSTRVKGNMRALELVTQLPG